jgi:tripartite-type tricarboxylate transporter receptor subunit TctC
MPSTMPPRPASRRRAVLGFGALAALLASAPVPALAQGDYPNRPVVLVVPFAAGGSTDLVARLVAAGMARELGRPVVVENRGGAGGNLGAAAVARSAPTGPRAPPRGRVVTGRDRTRSRHGAGIA